MTPILGGMDERGARVAAPVVVSAFACVAAVLGGRSVLVALAAVAVVVVGSVLLAARGVTGWRLVAGLGVVAAAFVVAGWGNPTNVGWFGICVVASWGVFGSSLAPGSTLGAGLALQFVVQALGSSPDPGWAAWVAGTVFTTVACTFARRQVDLVRELRLAQASLADRTRVEERNRVAAEVHDVIGHALTVSLLHVSSARLALDEDPEVARASLEEAERLARRSLDEVRAAVGAIRADVGDAPAPHARDLAGLVESFRRAGADVSLRVQGDVAQLPATRGLAVYRIVQESLTNAVKHGDGGPVDVVVEAGESVRVVVDNGTDGAAAARDGHGIVGMQERALAVGGRLEAGPGTQGWRVVAEVPR